MAGIQRKKIRLNFYQKTTGEGNTVTRVRLRRETFTPVRRKGVIHKVVGLKDRVSGDVPSVTKKLDSLEPKTIKGKTGLYAVKGAYKFSKTAVRAVFKTGLTVESVALFGVESLSPNKQTQLQFDRRQTSDGKYKTTVRLVNSTEFTRRNHRGILHKTAALKYCIKGDLPSLTKSLNAFKPKTFKGQTVKGLAKGTYKFVKTGAKTAAVTGLVAEDVTLITKDKAVNKLRSKIHSEATDDMSQGFLKTTEKAVKFVRTPIIYFKKRSDYKAEKQRLKFRKSEAKLLDVGIKFKGFSQKRPLLMITKSNGKQLELGFKRRRLFTFNVCKANSERNRVKAEFKKRKTVFSENKKKFKTYKKAYESSDKSNIGKAKLKRQKENFKAEKKDFKKFKKTAKKEIKFVKKARKNQRRLKKLINPHSILFNVAKGTISASWNKLSAQVSADNDMGKAVKNVVNGVVSAHRHIKNTAIKVTEYNDKRLDKKISTQRSKLKQQEYKLNKNRKKKKTAKYSWKRWYKHVGYNPRQSFSENVSNIVKKALKEIFKLTVSAVKYIVAGAMPLIAFIGCLLIVIYMVTGVFSQAGFVMGTYTAKDNVLSEAVTEYTKIASQVNGNLILCQNKNEWKKGLVNLGAIKSNEKNNYKITPDRFIYGKSSEFNYEADYDFDPYILWSFLSAFYYDFEKSHKAEKDGEEYEPDYWKLDRKGTEIIRELFDTEYSFQFKYLNYSRWEELSSYVIDPDDDGSSYWTLYDSPVKTQLRTYTQISVRAYNIPSEIERFTKDGILYFKQNNLEILNANDNFERTGWFLQDQRYIVDGRRSPFYFLGGDGLFYCGDTERVRTSWTWADNGQEIYWCVTPYDTKDWNYTLSNKCLVSFYKKNQWIEDCALYYTVQQKMNFEDSARSLLRTMNYPTERLEYFDFLIGKDKNVGKMYGNHQVIDSPIANKSIHDLIDENRIFNNYGYDVQEWNKQHCSINTDKHEGIDITCSMNEEILSPVDGKVTKIDENSIEITSDKIDFWYEEKEYKTRVTIDNIEISNFALNSEVKAGDVIGIPTPNHRCGTLNNTLNVNNRYIHMKIEINYSAGIWTAVDPRIIIS